MRHRSDGGKVEQRERGKETPLTRKRGSGKTKPAGVCREDFNMILPGGSVLDSFGRCSDDCSTSDPWFDGVEYIFLTFGAATCMEDAHRIDLLHAVP